MAAPGENPRLPWGFSNRSQNVRIGPAAEWMDRFAVRTALMTAGRDRRYLWTDAFAVCNFLGLHRATGEARHGAAARQLVEAVHHSLGRHRADDPRAGWLSGLSDRDGEAHPTMGGLRIGKALPERGPHEPADAHLEWDRDGQYFHYLTKWMHALDQMARRTGEAKYATWARELLLVAHRAFAYTARDGATRRMFWKMSIDLARPLVASMGQHDPLDGLVRCAQLEATAGRLGTDTAVFAALRADFASMLAPGGYVTDDPLGIGGLLVDAHALHQLGRDETLRDELLASAAVGLRHYAASREHAQRAEARLAFRELGLAIGLAALESMQDGSPSAPHLAGFDGGSALREAIVGFWLEPENRRARSWQEHLDINEVMLATSLVPEGFLVLG